MLPPPRPPARPWRSISPLYFFSSTLFFFSSIISLLPVARQQPESSAALTSRVRAQKQRAAEWVLAALGAGGQGARRRLKITVWHKRAAVTQRGERAAAERRQLREFEPFCSGFTLRKMSAEN